MVDIIKFIIKQQNAFRNAKKHPRHTKFSNELKQVLANFEIVENCSYTKDATRSNVIGFYNASQPHRQYFVYLALKDHYQVEIGSANPANQPQTRPMLVSITDDKIVLKTILKVLWKMAKE